MNGAPVVVGKPRKDICTGAGEWAMIGRPEFIV